MVRERPAPSARPQDALGETPDDLATHVARVEQDEVVDDHAVLQIAQAVDQFRGVRAPTADDGHLRPHAAQRNIRPCPSSGLQSPRLPSRRCSAFDGGSTKTDAVLVSNTGAVLGRARVGPSNHQLVGLEGMVEALTEAVAAVMEDAGLSGATAPGVPHRGVLPRRHRPARRRGEAGAGNRRAADGPSTPSCATTRSPCHGRARRPPGASASSAARE